MEAGESMWKVLQKKREKKKKNQGWKVKLDILGVKDSVKVNVVGDGEWEELEMAVDSGRAGETVVSGDVLGSIETVERGC